MQATVRLLVCWTVGPLVCWEENKEHQRRLVPGSWLLLSSSPFAYSAYFAVPLSPFAVPLLRLNPEPRTLPSLQRPAKSQQMTAKSWAVPLSLFVPFCDFSWPCPPVGPLDRSTVGLFGGKDGRFASSPRPFPRTQRIPRFNSSFRPPSPEIRVNLRYLRAHSPVSPIRPAPPGFVPFCGFSWPCPGLRFSVISVCSC
jgi:hypothetical protein